jgi:hypothetical protein
MDILGMIQKNDMLKVILLLIAVYFLMKYYNREGLDNVTDSPKPVLISESQPKMVNIDQTNSPLLAPRPMQPNMVELNVNDMNAPVLAPSAQQQQIEKVVAGDTRLTTNDLLPKYDDANDFAKQNPVSKLLQEQNFLQAGYHMGINTVVQSNKIPYLDIRSCPPIPKTDVGPFNNSSYEQPAGANRRFLEIGN